MTTGVEIRRARPHEFDACADLYLQVLRDTFEDAVLMGVDAGAMRQVLADLVASLQSPVRAA